MGYVIFNPLFFDAVDLDILQYLSMGYSTLSISHEFSKHPDRLKWGVIEIEKQINNLQELLSCQTKEHLVATAIRKHIIV
jgi:hypothetical protein